jgi:2-isopropylmalate synthase
MVKSFLRILKEAAWLTATFKAIEKIVKSDSELLLYSVSNITTGTDAQGEVTVRLAKGGRVVNGPRIRH